jgi:hypothetical protein
MTSPRVWREVATTNTLGIFIKDLIRIMVQEENLLF